MELQLFIADSQIIIPNTIVNTILVTILLSVFAIVSGSKAKKAKVDEPPSDFMNLVEIMVEYSNKMVVSNMGERNMVLAPFILTIMSFLVASNLTGLISITSPTADYSVTLTLALMIFFIVQFSKFKTSGGLTAYLKLFTKPYILMAPINLISEIANPVSMSFRLFGNVMSGTLIMAMLYNALGYFAPLVTPVLHLYFDLFTGILQAFIFTMLTMVFINNATQNN